jgi:tetratricopeptide (TPR) repeat protein
MEKRRWGEAEEHFEAALRINPQSYEAMNNLGVALLNQGREDEATERFHQAAAINPMGEVARENLKASVKRFLPLTGVALLLFLKAFALKTPLFFGWIALQASRLFFRSDNSLSWAAIFGWLLTLALTILYLIMLSSGIYSLRSSRFKHLPERLQSYIHMEHGRAWRGFVWRAAGGASLVILAWWGLLWSGHPQGEYAPQSITDWLIFIALCATTGASGAILWLERRRTTLR